MAGKYASLWEKKKSESFNETSTAASSNAPKINWFNANKALVDKKCAVRVLPIPGKDCWYVEIQKHIFKIGATWKNAACLETENDKGKCIGTCPICEMLNNNKEKLENNTSVGKIRAKSAYSLMVYNPKAGEIQRTELNYYGFMDILGYITAFAEDNDVDIDELVDNEGFTLHFKADENGYAAISGITKGKQTLDEIKNICKITDFPDFETYVMPTNNTSTVKYLENLCDLIVGNNLLPEIKSGYISASSNKPTPKKKIIDDEDSALLSKIKNRKVEEEEDDIDIDEEDTPPVKSKSSTKTVVAEEAENSSKGSKNSKIVDEDEDEAKPVKKKKKQEVNDISDDELDNLLEGLNDI